MFLFILVIFFLFNVSFANDLHGKIEYSENSARIEAFKDLARKIPKEMFEDFLKDKYYKENYENLKNKNYKIQSEPIRNINPFYMLNTLVVYSVEYESDINKKYYYNALGNLEKFEINDFNGGYPYRAISYNKKGEVMNISFVVSQSETYIFNKNEKLIGHWSDNVFLNKKNKINKHYKRIL